MRIECISSVYAILDSSGNSALFRAPTSLVNGDGSPLRSGSSKRNPCSSFVAVEGGFEVDRSSAGFGCGVGGLSELRKMRLTTDKLFKTISGVSTLAPVVRRRRDAIAKSNFTIFYHQIEKLF